MCLIVWLSPESHWGWVAYLNLCRIYPHLPYWVLILLSVEPVLCEESKPCGHLGNVGYIFSLPCSLLVVRKAKFITVLRSVVTDVPQVVTQSFWMMFFLVFSYSAVLVRCSLKDVLSSVMLRYFGVFLWVSLIFPDRTFSYFEENKLFRWLQVNSVLDAFG